MYSDLIEKWSRGVLESLRSVRPAFGINSRQLLKGSYVSRGDNLPWVRAASGIRKRPSAAFLSDDLPIGFSDSVRMHFWVAIAVWWEDRRQGVTNCFFPNAILSYSIDSTWGRQLAEI